MTPEQETMLLTSVAKIEQTVVHIRETSTRQEGAINTAHRRIDGHDVTRARMKGGMRVVGGLFVAFAALMGINWDQ